MLDYLSVEVTAPTVAGDRTVAVSIAGITASLRSGEVDLPLQILGAMQPFAVAACDATAQIVVRREDLRRLPLGEKIFDSGSVWQLYADKNGYQFRFAAPFSSWQAYRIARFNGDFSTGEILCDPAYLSIDEPVYPLEYPLDELLYMHLLAAGRGVIMHACGLEDGAGNGYLFAGQSGAGKSTMARLWAHRPEALVLSDERIVLTERAGRVLMHGTPWHGEAGMARNDHRRLTKIFFLRQWSTNEIVPLSRIEAAARLFACCFPPFHSAAGLSFTLRLFDEILRAIPAYELRFLADTSAVGIIEQA
jgi:hypothetical protein